MMKEIKITEIPGVRIGQAEDAIGGTGCTVFSSEKGAPCGLDVCGGDRTENGDWKKADLIRNLFFL